MHMQTGRYPAGEGCDSVIGSFRCPAEAELMGLLKNLAELKINEALVSVPSFIPISMRSVPHLRGKVFQAKRNAVLARRVQVAY